MTKLLAPLFIFTALSAATAFAVDRGAVRAACKDDIHRVCDGVKPGGGRIIECVKEHANELSPACKQTLVDQGLMKPDGSPAK